ncbi:MAG TPA: T9SS type A sorting domain-containing protein [Candidatus Kapabacteria bacterium]|nr:T9SS type A sorting domain-containing protein [Candidatus Kapabacteria bacterium]
MFSLPFQRLCAQAPIPNGDFEQWNGGAPVGWFVDNESTFTPITQTSDAHSGSSAVLGTVINLQGVAELTPLLISGTASVHGFSYTDHPNSFTGFYKFNPVGGDSLSITCGFQKNGNGIGEASFSTHLSASSYTAFAVPINWSTGDAPDTAIVSISIIVPITTSTANVNSTMGIDDLAFSNQIVSAVTPSESSSFGLEQNYPNPLLNTSSTSITYSIPESGYTTLTIYDMTGRSIAMPVRELESAGIHLVQFDVRTLLVGTYTYRLVSNGHSISRMMQILH